MCRRTVGGYQNKILTGLLVNKFGLAEFVSVSLAMMVGC